MLYPLSYGSMPGYCSMGLGLPQSNNSPTALPQLVWRRYGNPITGRGNTEVLQSSSTSVRVFRKWLAAGGKATPG